MLFTNGWKTTTPQTFLGKALLDISLYYFGSRCHNIKRTVDSKFDIHCIRQSIKDITFFKEFLSESWEW